MRDARALRENTVGHVLGMTFILRCKNCGNLVANVWCYRNQIVCDWCHFAFAYPATFQLIQQGIDFRPKSSAAVPSLP